MSWTDSSVHDYDIRVDQKVLLGPIIYTNSLKSHHNSAHSLIANTRFLISSSNASNDLVNFQLVVKEEQPYQQLFHQQLYHQQLYHQQLCHQLHGLLGYQEDGLHGKQLGGLHGELDGLHGEQLDGPHGEQLDGPHGEQLDGLQGEQLDGLPTLQPPHQDGIPLHQAIEPLDHSPMAFHLSLIPFGLILH